VLLAFSAALALTAYGIEAYVDSTANPTTAAVMVERKAEPAAPPAPAPIAKPASALSGTEAMVEAKPTEVTLAPVKIEAPRPAPAATPPPARVAAAPAAKPKAASSAKIATNESSQHGAGVAAPMLTSAPATTAATSQPQALRAKTRGMDDMVAPLERAAELAPVAPVELVVAASSQPAPTPAPARLTEPGPLRAIQRPQPEFPAAAAKDGVENGRVLARLTINGDGSVGRVEIVDAEPRNVFDREVRRALSTWRYEAPGQQRQTTVELLFKLEQ
jgi:protein TonB